MWVEDPEGLTAMFPENAVASLTGSLFAQPDDINTSKIMEAPFELPEILQATIEQVINMVTDPGHMMSTQDVLNTLEGFCM